MIYVKEKTDNTALLYITEDEAKELNIKWVDDIIGYEVINKQEEIIKMHAISNKLRFKSFSYDIAETTKEEKEELKECGIKENLPYSMFIKKNNDIDPIIYYIDMLSKETIESPVE